MGPFPLKQTEKGVEVQDETIICQWLRGCGAWLPRVTNEESALYSMQLWPRDWCCEHDSMGLHHPSSSDASQTGSFSESHLLSALLPPSQPAITSSQLLLLAASEPAMLNLKMQLSCTDGTWSRTKSSGLFPAVLPLVTGLILLSLMLQCYCLMFCWLVPAMAISRSYSVSISSTSHAAL